MPKFLLIKTPTGIFEAWEGDAVTIGKPYIWTGGVMRLKHARLLNFVLLTAMIFAIAAQWYFTFGVLFVLFVLNMVS